MVCFGKIRFPFLVLLLAIRLDGAGPDAGTEEVRHQVRVMHPAVSDTDVLDGTLVQVRGADGRPDEFHMDVDSVSCADEQCKIVPVRIFWDELGFYSRFELAPGVELEKAEGKPFSESDYAKLHRVLAERGSSMWDLKMDQYLQRGGKKVDVVSSPTIIMDKSRYVEGAVWTCCTLWHWANGGIGTWIREKTARASSIEELREHLKNGAHDYKVFALQQITKRNAYDPETLAAVVNCSSEDDYELLKLLVQYVENAAPGPYYSSVGKLLHSGSRKLRLRCLNSILTTKHEAPRNFHERLGGQLTDSEHDQHTAFLAKHADRL